MSVNRRVHSTANCFELHKNVQEIRLFRRSVGKVDPTSKDSAHMCVTVRNFHMQVIRRRGTGGCSAQEAGRDSAQRGAVPQARASERTNKWISRNEPPEFLNRISLHVCAFSVFFHKGLFLSLACVKPSDQTSALACQLNTAPRKPHASQWVICGLTY